MDEETTITPETEGVESTEEIKPETESTEEVKPETAESTEEKEEEGEEETAE
ncbi:MAG: hypothetical protein V1858_04515 [Candidatus Gottesmanbacteria bacterium]